MIARILIPSVVRLDNIPLGVQPHRPLRRADQIDRQPGSTDAGERLGEIADNVVDVLNADGRPDGGVRDAKAFSGLRDTPECTVVAGWQTKDSVPPRLTASLKTCNALSTAKGVSLAASHVKRKVLPAPVHWRRNSA
jgi:hypothetical protein